MKAALLAAVLAAIALPVATKSPPKTAKECGPLPAAFEGVGRQEGQVRAQGRFLDGGGCCRIGRFLRGCMGRVGQRQAAREGGKDKGGDDLVHGFLLLG